MKSKQRLMPVLFISIALIASSVVFANGSSQHFDVTVGHRTSDSTAQATISGSSIQQSILPTISFLAGSTVTNEEPIISVGDSVSYLIFTVTKSTGDTQSVAVELNVSAQGSFSYQSGANRPAQICKPYGLCSKCGFAKDRYNIIRDCFLKNVRTSTEIQTAGCRYYVKTNQQ